MKRFRRIRGNSGFTFIEITVVLVIFVLLAGAIYATVNAAITASAVLSEENIRSQRLGAFIGLLRRTFHNLPATAQVSGGVRVDGGKGIPEIVLRDAPGVFAWGPGNGSAGTILLSALPRLGGGMQFSLLSLPSSLGEQERSDALQNGKWLRLLPDLRDARWRFFDEAQQDWREDWPEGMARPLLVELTLLQLGEEVPRTYIFWLPPVKEQTPSVSDAPPEGEGAPGPQPVPPGENPVIP
jgi:prepilin-type N-terminal cleavage/methylation domain-containing protein